MKTMRFLILVLVIKFFLTQFIFSQTKTSLIEVINVAIENNQQLKSSRLNIQKENAMKLKAFNIPKPQLFTEFEGIKGSLSNAESRKIGVLQELEFPTNYFLRADVQTSQIRIAEAELNERINHLKAEVKMNYFSLLLRYKFLETAMDVMKIYDDFLFVAQKKYDVGETSSLEVLGAKVNKIKIENQVRNMESEIKTIQSELRNLMNVNYDIQPSEELTYSEITLSKPELLKVALNNNPGLKIIKFQKEKFSNKLSLAKGELLPDISLSYYSQKLGNESGFWGFQIGLGIPFWFWGEQSGNIKESNYEFQIASSEEINFQKSLENNLNKSFEEYQNSLRQLKFFKDEAIGEADEVFRQAKVSYEEGAIGYVEYLQSLAIVYDVKTQYLNSIYNYNKSLINLEEIIAGDIK